MAVILALDTSTEACSCALAIDGAVHERYELQPRQHARLLLPMIRDLLGECGLGFSALDAVACGRGPGSFTGLRIAAGVAQGIAFAADVPVLPVSGLAALALDIHNRTAADTVLAVLDARIDEVYVAQYRFVAGLPLLAGTEQLCKPEQIRVDPVPMTAGGNGLAYWPRFPAAIVQQTLPALPDLLPRAALIAILAAEAYSLGKGLSAWELQPVYLRDQVARVQGQS